ncbi:D-methionine ABC transporter substrate-binding protein [Bordetella ansorpii]|uniref:D-methionine ABC transporter substrate-binding protein n=1 Tax=Bordetella ansorpii TaxID=288768 RepID=A0A157SX51_9BORD|nr:MetQ/NlpA family ABC transporter substrate-binding protein [Bordetella ansorpii]SAI74865.1 D-methionine ABC transporter substrate-binding protein [Bordetella ansorpii]
MSRVHSFLSRLGLAAALFAMGAGAQAASPPPPLRIGVIASVANQATELAIEEARKQGLEVKLVEFSDWVLPNIAVADGSIDANFFQHEPFLQLFNKSRGAELVPVAYGYSTTIGLFSKKLKRGDTVPEGATIAVPNDPVNTGRALLLLQSVGLLKLREGTGHQATLQDVVANPRKLRLVQLEGSQSARTFDDVTASVTYTTFAKHAGIDEKDGLAFDNTDPDTIRRYAIRWVARADRAGDPRLRQFIRIYQESPQVKATLRKLYGDLIDFPWETPAR